MCDNGENYYADKDMIPKCRPCFAGDTKAWAGLPLNIHFKFPWLFNDFSLTFNRFPDPFGRPILAIFIHWLFEDSAQIFEFVDLIFKEKS